MVMSAFALKESVRVPQSLLCKAPASMMLFGEHSILREGRAIVSAISKWLSVKIVSRETETIEVFSSFGKESCPFTKISLSSRLRFVEAALQRFSGQLQGGFSIHIVSEIDPTMGLGSSASVSVAMLMALAAWTGQSWTKETLLEEAVSLIRSVQGCGSGADAASIVYGGVIAFDGKKASPLAPTLPLVSQYCGYKTPTPHVVKQVNDREKRLPLLFSSLFSTIDAVTEEAISAIQKEELSCLGGLMNTADGLMQALGVGTRELSDLCWRFRNEPSIFGAKISGSGLGDCVVALGSSKQKTLPVSVSEQGVVLQ